MYLNKSFNKLLNLAIEIDEEKIKSERLKSVLERESIPFQETEDKVNIQLLNQIIPLNFKKMDTKPLWDVIEQFV